MIWQIKDKGLEKIKKEKKWCKKFAWFPVEMDKGEYVYKIWLCYYYERKVFNRVLDDFPHIERKLSIKND